MFVKNYHLKKLEFFLVRLSFDKFKFHRSIISFFYNK